MPSVAETCLTVLQSQSSNEIFSTQDFYTPMLKSQFPGKFTNVSSIDWFPPANLSEDIIGNKNQKHILLMSYKYGEPLPNKDNVAQFKGDIGAYVALWAAVVNQSKVGSCLPLSCWGVQQVLSRPSWQTENLQVLVVRLKHYDHYVLIILNKGQTGKLDLNQPSSWPATAFILDLYARNCYPASDFCEQMKMLLGTNSIHPYYESSTAQSFSADCIFDSAVNHHLPTVEQQKITEIVSTNSIYQYCGFFAANALPKTKMLAGTMVVAASALAINYLAP